MLIWSLVLSLAALQVAQAAPKSSRPQYSSLGKHGGVATEVRAYDPRVFSFVAEMAFSHIVPTGCGMLRNRNRDAHARWKRG